MKRTPAIALALILMSACAERTQIDVSERPATQAEPSCFGYNFLRNGAPSPEVAIERELVFSLFTRIGQPPICGPVISVESGSGSLRRMESFDDEGRTVAVSECNVLGSVGPTFRPLLKRTELIRDGQGRLSEVRQFRCMDNRIEFRAAIEWTSPRSTAVFDYAPDGTLIRHRPSRVISHDAEAGVTISTSGQRPSRSERAEVRERRITESEWSSSDGKRSLHTFRPIGADRFAIDLEAGNTAWRPQQVFTILSRDRYGNPMRIRTDEPRRSFGVETMELYGYENFNYRYR